MDSIPGLEEELTSRPTGWSSPDSWLTWIFSPNLYVIFLALFITILLPTLSHFYIFARPSRKLHTPTFVLLGPPNAGKTSLVSLLQRRTVEPERAEASPTRTSQTAATVRLALPTSVALGSNKYRSANDTSVQEAARNATQYCLIDTPGHGKLRSEQGLDKIHDPSVKGVLFMVDAAALDSVDLARDTASYLHDTLLALQKRKTGKGTSVAKTEIPVLVAANKQDLFTALPPGAVKERLQTEIERVKVSRSRGLGAAGEDVDAVEEEEVLGGGGEEKFTFAHLKDEYGISVEVLGGAVRGEEAGKGVTRWEQWIGSCL